MTLPGLLRTGSVLDRILVDVCAREAARVTSPRADAAPCSHAFSEALGAPGLSVIAECKRRSPSEGAIAAPAEAGPEGVVRRAGTYARGGAAALSILTEPTHFGGTLDDLRAAAGAGLPRLRKDFVVNAAMVHDAALAGADAVLLIAACLGPGLLRDLRDEAAAVGLDVLVEVHDEHELERALAVDPECVGVNARDLGTFGVDLRVSERLLPRIPEGVIRVAESGIGGAADARRMAAAGADAALVGTALMRAPEPGALIAELRAAGGPR